ncbi:MAG: hypothetical protein ACOX51_01115 [Myxococcota bacterium]|nr:hypothetical protein [Myxococcota bacterium]OQC35625.1 MAG: hypothetical protein BWX66_01543 [Deltaproteobacteria bacterium ADurb.Bin058]HHW97911.1 hypothetical protein [Oligoflexales bacterium]MBP8970802.1 hypothetical protein [Myxococcota bacterium]HQC45390.1 hypothetical protein [Myxococcota bacterium]
MKSLVRLVFIVILGLPAMVFAFPNLAGQQGAQPPNAMQGQPAVAAVTVQVLPFESGLVVTQAIGVSGTPGNASFVIPLLLPTSGPRPMIAPGAIQARTAEGTRLDFTPKGIVMSGVFAPGRQLLAEVSYEIPVVSSRLVFEMTANVPVVSTTVITKRDRDYGLHVRPLLPFSFKEEDGEDGTWIYQNSLDELPAGQPLRIAVGHLPYATAPYRTAALIIAAIVAAGLGISLVTHKRED